MILGTAVRDMTKPTVAPPENTLCACRIRWERGRCGIRSTRECRHQPKGVSRSMRVLRVILVAAVAAVSAAPAVGAGFDPRVITFGSERDEIKSIPIEKRPNRPLHVYGNSVRRRQSRTPQSSARR